jgi:hypothetical protein
MLPAPVSQGPRPGAFCLRAVDTPACPDTVRRARDEVPPQGPLRLNRRRASSRLRPWSDAPGDRSAPDGEDRSRARLRARLIASAARSRTSPLRARSAPTGCDARCHDPRAQARPLRLRT